MCECEQTINEIQKILNHCIYNSLENYKNTIKRKTETKSEDEILKIEQDERDHVLDELSKIYARYPAFRLIKDYIDDPNFIDKSKFVFWLPSDDEYKWRTSHCDITYEDFCLDDKALDDSFPHFSKVYEVVVKEKYVKFLKERITESKEKIKKLETEKKDVQVKRKDEEITLLMTEIEQMKANEKSKDDRHKAELQKINNLVKSKDKKNACLKAQIKQLKANEKSKDDKHKAELLDIYRQELRKDEENASLKAKTELINTKDKKGQKSFGHNFNDKEFEILAQCIKNANMFEDIVTPEVIKSFFNCEIETSLKSKDNTKVVYLFKKLHENNRIIREWKSVIGINKLIKGPKGAILKSSNLSNCKIKDHSKYKLIQNYINLLK